MKWSFILIFYLLIACSATTQKLYEEKMEKLQMMMGGERYYALIDYFKKSYNGFPDSLNKVYLAYKHDYPEDIKSIELNHFIDVFSKNDKWVGYFPIYDSSDSEVISYILLSAGIDGKLDNVYDPAHKLHEDDWKQQLKLYNPDEFDGVSIFSEELSGVDIYSEEFIRSFKYARKGGIEARPYNATEEKSGNKDLLIYVHHFLVPGPEYENE